MGFWVYLKNTVFSSGMFWNGDSLYITVTGVTERSVHSKTIFFGESATDIEILFGT